jgi:hypothetical protein
MSDPPPTGAAAAPPLVPAAPVALMPLSVLTAFENALGGGEEDGEVHAVARLHARAATAMLRYFMDLIFQ